MRFRSLDQTIGQLDESSKQTIKRKDAEHPRTGSLYLKLEEIVRLEMLQSS